MDLLSLPRSWVGSLLVTSCISPARPIVMGISVLIQFMEQILKPASLPSSPMPFPPKLLVGLVPDRVG
uniref:Uncharacterized protein n=1 Tax=Picea glauca TaxID=3330 RepID=A0A101M5A1_PICGL|nr:hypothetical protein ABT39_MTgene1112 [Picea glauca]QHR87770.1 hypothetical protein Q903MT_gene1782 [Picea sitchensis]